MGGVPVKSQEEKRKDALKRSEDYNQLSAKQKLKRLDERLGKSKGASRERDRLNAQLVSSSG